MGKPARRAREHALLRVMPTGESGGVACARYVASGDLVAPGSISDYPTSMRSQAIEDPLLTFVGNLSNHVLRWSSALWASQPRQVDGPPAPRREAHGHQPAIPARHEYQAVIPNNRHRLAATRPGEP
jgi:hypothetical protein